MGPPCCGLFVTALYLGIRTLARWLCGMGPQGEDLLKPMVIRDGTAGSRDSHMVCGVDESMVE